LLSGCGVVQVQVHFGPPPTATPMPTPTPTPSVVATLTFQEAAYNACKNATLDRLVAPSTAVFPPFDPSMAATEADVPMDLFITMYVDSQNVSGAQVRSHVRCAVGPLGQILYIDIVTR